MGLPVQVHGAPVCGGVSWDIPGIHRCLPRCRDAVVPVAVCGGHGILGGEPGVGLVLEAHFLRSAQTMASFASALRAKYDATQTAPNKTG